MNYLRCLVLCGVFLLPTSTFAQNSEPSSLSLPATPPSYRALATQTEDNLRTQVLNQWFPRAVSNEFGGGFDQNFSENWTNTSKGERSLVYQSRLTWLASQAALRYPAESTKWKGFASHGADFLRTQMWDAQNGGFFWALENNKPARDGEKHAYGIAFAIYALCSHFRATGDARSLALAQQAFRWLDTHAHDAKNGGYLEALTRQGKPILAPPTGEQPSDFIGTRYGYKSMNTHIHLLEAFTALSEVWKNKPLRSRLDEVFLRVRDTIVVSPPGTMHLYFRPDWKPVPDHDSFGHDIETAYLLIEATTALGHPEDERTWKVARSLVDHTLDFAFDYQNGGVYNEGTAFGSVTDSGKVWWVQAESLNALLLMHQKYGATTQRYWQAFQKHWAFIRDHQTDPANGGWFARVSQTGQPTPGADKSDGWTESYHQGRALLNVSRKLHEMTK